MKFGLAGFVCFVTFVLFQPANAQEKPVEEQILDIITSSSGTVRKWMRAPKLVVVYDQESYEEEINALVEEINTRVTGFPGFREVEYFDLNRFDGQILDGVSYLEGAGTDNPVDFSHLLALLFNSESNGISITTIVNGNIFIFLVNTENGTLFGEILASNNSRHHRRIFAEDSADTTCYVNVGSNNDEIISGWIFINSNDGDSLIKHCIYEELTQSLGALYDTDLSSVFTYNDRSGPVADADFDYRLLNSIYNKSIYPGSLPERVVEIYNDLSK